MMVSSWSSQYTNVVAKYIIVSHIFTRLNKAPQHITSWLQLPPVHGVYHDAHDVNAKLRGPRGHRTGSRMAMHALLHDVAGVVELKAEKMGRKTGASPGLPRPGPCFRASLFELPRPGPCFRGSQFWLPRPGPCFRACLFWLPRPGPCFRV